jgi:hypothetical protein
VTCQVPSSTDGEFAHPGPKSCAATVPADAVIAIIEATQRRIELLVFIVTSWGRRICLPFGGQVACARLSDLWETLKRSESF